MLIWVQLLSMSPVPTYSRINYYSSIHRLVRWHIIIVKSFTLTTHYTIMTVCHILFRYHLFLQVLAYLSRVFSFLVNLCSDFYSINLFVKPCILYFILFSSPVLFYFFIFSELRNCKASFSALPCWNESFPYRIVTRPTWLLWLEWLLIYRYECFDTTLRCEVVNIFVCQQWQA